MRAAGPDAAEIDQVLDLLQSADNTTRQRAEAQLDAWSQNPAILTTLMARTHLAAAPGSRQLAATVLAWRISKIWPNLEASDQAVVQSALLECFSKCHELTVLRALGEACNALCQAIAVQKNVLWEDLVRLVASLISSDAALHRRVALEVLASLVDSMGARLQPHYPDIGQTMAARVRDSDVDVVVAALVALGTLASSFCRSDGDHSIWKSAADATLEVAAQAVAAPVKTFKDGPKVVSASLRTLTRLTLALHSEALARASAELACRVISAPNSPEHCSVQALQLLRVLVRRTPDLIDGAILSMLPVVCSAVKDEAPAVDDLDEVSQTALAARDCLRVLARASPSRVIPVVYDIAGNASASRDAVDRASSVHMVSFALCGAREAPTSWAMPLSRALSDPAVWVRQAACEGAATLAEALQPCPVTTEGLLLLLSTVAERLPVEQDVELMRKAANAAAAIFKELSSDEAAGVLCLIVQALLQALPSAAIKATSGGDSDDTTAAMATSAALATAIAAAAGAAADHFSPLAQSSANVLLPLLRAGPRSSSSCSGVQALSPAAYAACLEAAGAVVASAFQEASFQAARDELAAVAQQALVNAQGSSEVRASGHIFFASVALASFEEFAPYLTQVVPLAVESLRSSDGGEAGANSRRHAVRTGGQEERVAAIDALGTYAAAVGARFGEFLPTALPAICAQAGHASPEVRAATARSLERLGRCLGDLASRLPAGPSQDRVAAEGMAQAIAQALCGFIAASQHDGGAVLRSGLQAREDLIDCGTFAPIAGPEAMAAIASAGTPGQRSEDVASSVGDDEADDAEDDE